MLITKFENFIMESKHELHRFGCVKIDLGIKGWNSITSKIEKEDIYEPDPTFGIETNPHLTLLYGLHKGVSIEDVKECFKDIKGPIKIESSGINIFKNPDFDVVKINVKENYILDKIYKNLIKLPNSYEYDDYVPHITISYVKSGKGKKYVDPNYDLTINNISEIKYSSSSGQKFRFRI